MNNLERFKYICNGEKPDYIPILGMPGASGLSRGISRPVYDRLISQGMPDVGGVYEEDGTLTNPEGWQKHFGVCCPIQISEPLGISPEPLKWETRTEGRFEYLTCETGAYVRQFINNNILYSMPEFIRFHVRDRESWERYKERCPHIKLRKESEINIIVDKYKNRTEPLSMHCVSTFGALRNLVGTEMACTTLYENPDLAHEIIEWFREEVRNYTYPLIKLLKPEILTGWEDMCYNHGMFISPAMFREFCFPAYQEVAEVAREAGVTLFAVDSDGNVGDLVPLLVEAGVNGLYPWEVKAGNDMFKIREKYPGFNIFGGLEKEILNEGNDALIKPEIMNKVPKMIEKGRYFPNIDHGIQPLISYKSLLSVMTLLHDVLKNPEGNFQRILI